MRTDPTSASLSRTAWLVVALLMPVALLNYLDRQMLASMKTSVMGDIPSIGTEENWGFMLGQFKWVYAVLSPIGGYLADRLSRRKVICASLFVWSAITWWTGHVHTYHDLLWARSLMGISEAFYIPAALALISDYHTGRTRSRAVGLHQMAIYGGIIAGGFAGYIADWPKLGWQFDFDGLGPLGTIYAAVLAPLQLGWRFAFDACGVFGMLYALPLALLLRDPPRSEETAARAGVSPLHAAGELSTNPAFVLLVLYFTLPALAGWVMTDWMPAVLKQEYEISQGKAGVTAALYLRAASIASAVVGGWLADRWMRRTGRGRIYVSALGMGMIVLAIFGMGAARSLDAMIVCLIFFGAGWGWFDTNNMPILCQIVRPELRATGYGVMNMVSISFGGLADWGFGVLRDRGVPMSAIFGGFATTTIASVALVLLIRPRKELLAQEHVR